MADLLKNNGIPIPQYADEKTGKMKPHLGNQAPFQQLVDENGVPFGKSNPLPVKFESLNIDLGSFDPE